MGQPAAKQGDQIVPTGDHVHWVNVSSPPFQVPARHPCTWKISENLSMNVFIEKKRAATLGSAGDNAKQGTKHEPQPPGTPAMGFSHPPPDRMDKATITKGSGTVNINGKPAARHGSSAETCNEPVGDSTGTVNVGACTVWIGG